MKIITQVAVVLASSWLVAACGGEPARSPNEGFHPPVGSLRASDRKDEHDVNSVGRDGRGIPQKAETGEASFYGDKFRGKKTASGDPYEPDLRTAAHRTLPFGTYVEVKRTDTGRAIVVRINDRGPFGRGSRIIDLSLKAATELDMLRDGVVPVEVRVVPGP